MRSRRPSPFALVLMAALPCPARDAGTSSGRDTHVPYRQLAWSDFRTDDASPGFSAQTETFLTYRYTARAAGRPGRFEAMVVRITFSGGFDRARSWRRSNITPDDTRLLEHEQGHLDINELKARQLRTLRPTDLPVGQGKTRIEALKDLYARLAAFQRRQTRDVDGVQKGYDAETRFGTDGDVQARWTERLRRALRALPAK
jgi:hypothetical protein